MNDIPEQVFTVGQVARRLHVKIWQVQRIFERGLVPEPPRFGIMRSIPESMVAAIAAQAKLAGYIK